MFQDNKPGQGSGPQDLGRQAAGAAANQAVNKATEAAGEKTKETAEKVQKGAQVAGQVAGYAGMAQQAGSAFSAAPGGLNPAAGGINPTEGGGAGMANATPSTADSFAAVAADMLGVSHLTLVKIVIDGQMIRHYKHFQMNQSAVQHHSFSLTLDHDALGTPQDHQLAEAQGMLGKRITVTLSYKNLSGSPERDFIGIVTRVGLSREHGNKGNIVLSGYSPTFLLDGAPHIQSFGGTSPMSLSSIVQSVLKEGLGGDYETRVEPTYDTVGYSCQYDETHYNFLARTAEAYGEQFFYDGKVLHFGKMPPPEKAIKLVFGRDVDEIEVNIKALHVNPSFYGYNSSNDEKLTAGKTSISHQSALGKDAQGISEKVFTTPSLRIAPIKARTGKDVEAAQKSTAGSAAVNVFTTSGRTSVPFLYPGCTVEMEMRKAGGKESDYFTRLMVIEVVHSVDTKGNYVGYFEAIGADTGYMPRPLFQIPIAEPQFATIKSNTDKDNQGRVQVQFDWQQGDAYSEFIRVMTPDAGGSDKVSKNRGFMAIPEVGDQVMVGFVHNHPDRPYVMGGMYTGKVGGGGGGGNNMKSFSSKSGHTVSLNDGGAISIVDKTGGNSVVVDGNNKVTVTSSQTVELTNGKASITLEGDKITIYADQIEIAKSGGDSSKIEIKGLTTVLSGKNDVTVKSDTKATVDSGGTTDVKAKGALTAKAAVTTVKADGITAVQGGTVNIN